MRLRSNDISTRTLGDETIVLNLANSRYFTISGAGSRSPIRGVSFRKG